MSVNIELDNISDRFYDMLISYEQARSQETAAMT
jgi:hypothetical protein